MTSTCVYADYVSVTLAAVDAFMLNPSNVCDIVCCTMLAVTVVETTVLSDDV